MRILSLLRYGLKVHDLGCVWNKKKFAFQRRTPLFGAALNNTIKKQTQEMRVKTIFQPYNNY